MFNIDNSLIVHIHVCNCLNTIFYSNFFSDPELSMSLWKEFLQMFSIPWSLSQLPFPGGTDHSLLRSPLDLFSVNSILLCGLVQVFLVFLSKLETPWEQRPYFINSCLSSVYYLNEFSTEVTTLSKHKISTKSVAWTLRT